MNQSFLTLSLHGQRDALVARQRARQIAGLLGFEPREQALIGAAVFEIAVTAMQQSRPTAIRFHLDNDVLRVVPAATSDTGIKMTRRVLDRLVGAPGCVSRTLLHLEKPLPKRVRPIALEDLPWTVQQLAQLTPLNLLEEIRQQNRELLGLCLELQARQAEMAQLQSEMRRSSAA